MRKMLCAHDPAANATVWFSDPTSVGTADTTLPPMDPCAATEVKVARIWRDAVEISAPPNKSSVTRKTSVEFGSVLSNCDSNAVGNRGDNRSDNHRSRPGSKHRARGNDM
jgi:hypothetical protein